MSYIDKSAAGFRKCNEPTHCRGGNDPEGDCRAAVAREHVVHVHEDEGADDHDEGEEQHDELGHDPRQDEPVGALS